MSKYRQQILLERLKFAPLVTGVAVDSRKVEEGNLFFALSGARTDGHSFLRDVASKGAVGAV
ncbi:Mur ligase domain-containing protein, partial [Clostridium sp. ZBS18]|uniref:Mur ligase domain-containing protein n=1 Tax=Clostridium sp. ZBS18 TaxID=2949967 RepID=UPI00207B01B3